MATALPSPTRKGRSLSTHHSSNTLHMRKKEVPEVISEVAVVDNELRSLLLQGDFAPRQLDNIREKLSRLDLSTKHNEKELELVIQAFSFTRVSPESTSLVASIVEFVARLCESANSGALKNSENDALLVLLALKLCDCQDRQTDQPELEAQIAKSILGVLRVAGPQRQWNRPLLCQLLLHSLRNRQPSTPDVDNTVAALLEALGYACVGSDGLSATALAALDLGGEATSDAAKTAMLHNRKLLLQRVEQLGGPASNTAEMRRHIVDELTKRIQAAHAYLSRLPGPLNTGSSKGGTFSTPSSAKLFASGDNTLTNLSAKLGSAKLEGISEKTVFGSSKTDCGPITFAETERQLRILLASLRGLAFLFEHCVGSAGHSASANATAMAKSVAKLNASEITAYFALVPLIDRMLRNVMPTLGRRLQMVVDIAELDADTAAFEINSIPAQSSATAPVSSVDTAAAPKKALVGKSDAYRPPAQRSTTAAQPADASALTAGVERSGNKIGNPAPASVATVSPQTRTMVLLKGQLSAQLVRLLGAVAALNPSLFTNSWGLFLSDSIVAESALHEKCNTIVRAATAVSATSVAAIGDETVQPSVATGKLSSPILGTVLHSTTVEVRSAAVTALLRFLSSLPLRTYFAVARPGTIGRFEARSSSTSRAVGGATQGQSAGSGVYDGGAAAAVGGAVGALASGGAMSKQQKLLLKIVDTLVVALDTEQNEHVLELLLKLASLLLDHMPLGDNWRTVRSARFAALAESANVYEGRATALYVLALRAALRYDVPELAHSVVALANTGTGAWGADSSGSASKIRNIAASYVALSWIAERCKHANQTNALHRALHIAYLPAAAHHTSGIDQGSGNGGRTLIYAAAQCLLRAVPPANTNNLYCMAVRTLNSCLAQYFPAMYLADPSWLRNLLSVLEIHAQTGLRLQGSKMLAFLLDYDLLNLVVLPTHLPIAPPGGGDFVRDVGVSAACFGETFTQCIAAGRTLEETFASMLRSCADDAHIVRTQAMATIGSLTAYVWRVLHGLPCSEAEHLIYLSMHSAAKGGAVDSAPLTKRLLLLRCLLVGAKDSVGTVRTAAYKSIGDCVVNSALLLSAPALPSLFAASTTGAAVVHPLLDAAEVAYMNDLVSSLAVGILDTKLSVRVQAAWALGNTIVNLLPYRWKHGAAPAASLTAGGGAESGAAGGAARQAVTQTKSHPPSQQQQQQQSALPHWLSDACWIALFSDLLPLLHDSEKLAATAIRCVGNVGAGLFPHLSQLHRETVCSLHEALVQRYLVPSYTPPSSRPGDSDYWQVLSNLKAPVVEHTQKVVFSLTQSLGFVLHALSRDLGRNESLVYITEVEEVHMSFLKYGKLKTQLQAAQVLLYGQCLTQDMQERGSADDGVARTAQLIRLLECLLSLAVSTLPSKTSAVAAVVPVSRGPAHTIQKGSSPAAVAERTPSSATRLKETDAEAGDSGEASPGGGGGSAEVEDAPAEVVLLFRSRAAELLHYYVLLLHVVLSQLWRTSCGDGGSGSGAEEGQAERRRAVRQSVLELLLYYGEDLATWTEALGMPSFLPNGQTSTAHGNTVFTPVNTTVGLPHVDYDICAVLHCRGRTHQAMVTEIAALVLRFSTPSDDTSNISTSPQLSGLSLKRLPSLAAEQLPAALMGRFAECAQYASAEYRHALFGAQTELYYQPSHAAHYHYHSHAGSVDPSEEGYGVFDGLDVQACLQSLPVSLLRSPQRSPAKGLGHLEGAKASALSVEASPGLAYAVPSNEGEEDEF